MNKRVSGTKGKPSRNKAYGRIRLKQSIRKAMHEKSEKARLDAEKFAEQQKQAVQHTPSPMTRAKQFFQRAFNRGQRGR